MLEARVSEVVRRGFFFQIEVISEETAVEGLGVSVLRPGSAAYAFPNAMMVAVHNEGWAHFTQAQDDVAKAFTTLEIGGRLELLRRGVATGFAWTE